MNVSPLTIGQLGEHEVLRRLYKFCAAVVGDDGAVQALPTGEQLVVTTDVLVDGVHFCDRTLPPTDLGWRAVAVNLSDLAAMGAMPLGITIGLTLPADTPWPWVNHLYEGITQCLNRYGGHIIGGDLCRGNHRSLAITALGTVKPHQALYRNTAQPGQTLVTTGIHGAARTGLALLLNELSPQPLPENLAQRWITAHQRPCPRFDAISILRRLYGGPIAAMDTSDGLADAVISDPVAVMDTSDGLADAVIQICSQSQVGATLQQSQLPIPPGLSDVVSPDTARQWTLYGGEDFELVLSLPPEIAQAFVHQLPGSHIIGQTTVEPEIRLVDDITQGDDIYLDQNKGYQHFG